jgi:hypothetical protein
VSRPVVDLARDFNDGNSDRYFIVPQDSWRAMVAALRDILKEYENGDLDCLMGEIWERHGIVDTAGGARQEPK